jgi:hypothetical protein
MLESHARPFWPRSCPITKQEAQKIQTGLTTGIKDLTQRHLDGEEVVNALWAELCDPTSCDKDRCKEAKGKQAQKGWASRTHSRKHFPLHFDEYGFQPWSSWHDLTPGDWLLLGIPVLFVRSYTPEHKNMGDDEE